MKWFDPTNGEKSDVKDYVLKDDNLIVTSPSVNSSGVGGLGTHIGLFGKIIAVAKISDLYS